MHVKYLRYTTMHNKAAKNKNLQKLSIVHVYYVGERDVKAS